MCVCVWVVTIVFFFHDHLQIFRVVQAFIHNTFPNPAPTTGSTTTTTTPATTATATTTHGNSTYNGGNSTYSPVFAPAADTYMRR